MPDQPLSSQKNLGLYDLVFRVTVRAYHADDAEHLARVYKDRIASLAPTWPVDLDGIEPSTRQAI